MAKKTSTRNTEFNYYIENDTVKTATTATAGASSLNLTLLESGDCVEKTGQFLIDDANANFNTPGEDNPKFNGKIDTSNLDANETYKIYGTPHKMVLDNKQQYNNCGIVSTLNTLVMAGIKTISNQNKTETSFTKQMWDLGLASDDGTIGKFEEQDGGTQPGSYKEIFEYYGIESDSYASEPMGGGSAGEAMTIDELINSVKDGGAAIIAVSSAILWGRKNTNQENYVVDHAIAVTGIVCDSADNVVGFYIHDTAMWMTRYISYDDLKTATMYDEKEKEWKTSEGIFGTLVKTDIKSNVNNLNLTGSKHDNILTGNSGNNTLKGMNGNDELYGLAGIDKVYGGNGNDVVDGGADDDNLYGDAGNDIIIGGEGNDVIRGGKGTDWIYANEGIASTDLTEDYLDNLEELVGRNIIYGDAGEDHIFGGNYNDLIYGGTGNDFLYGRDGVDVIYGGKGDDYISGGKGEDRLLGQAGNDVIEGGKGNDVILCGAGKDRVIVNHDEGLDKISSSSGSVTFVTDKSAWKLDYKYDNAVKALYDEYNGFEYQGFFNSKKNKSQTAYIEDINHDTYKLSATKSSGKIKVSTTKGNNILFSTSTKNNIVTTSNYNDIVWLKGGDNTITYTGGKDKYISGTGNDSYIINNFDYSSYVSINDSLQTDESTEESSNNDVLKINTDSADLRLFFDVQRVGKTSDIYDNLYIITSDFSGFDTIFNENATGVISVCDYFKKDVDIIDTTQYQGKGYIENIFAGSSELDIASTIASITENVMGWLMDGEHFYDSVADALSDENVSDLLAYFNTEIQIAN